VIVWFCLRFFRPLAIVIRDCGGRYTGGDSESGTWCFLFLSPDLGGFVACSLTGSAVGARDFFVRDFWAGPLGLMRFTE